jgi:hypothetical protein
MRGRFILAMIGLVLAAGAALAAPASEKPTNPSVRTYPNITPAILTCMAARSRKKYGTVYTPDSTTPTIGISETHYYGLTRLSFVFDAAGATMTYTILHKPTLASNSQVWDGVRDAIKACS